MPLFDHFGILAPFYERVIPVRASEKLLDLIDLPVRGPLLDVGGGTGRIAQLLRGQANPVVVMDESLGMLAQARQKDGLRAVGAHSERLPFQSQSFERILMVDALHHVGSQLMTAQELCRVLKPGGVIVIEEPDLRNFAVKLVALAEKLALMRSHFLAPAAIANLFTGLGCRTKIQVEGFNAYVVMEKG